MNKRISLCLVIVVSFSVLASLFLASCDALLAAAVKDADPAGTAVPGMAPILPSDGTVANPVTITLGTSQAIKVANFDDVSDGYSYYSFQTGAGISYDIVLSNLSPSSGDLDIYIYSAAGFINQTNYKSSVTTSWSGIGLSANTKYYLKLYNGSSTNLTGNLVVRSHLPANDGTSSSPVMLTVGTPWSGKVGQSTNGDDYSYYKFVATAGMTKVLSVSNINGDSDLDYYLYDSALMSSSIWSTYTNSGGTIYTALTTGTTYYLKVRNYAGSTNTTYTIVIN